MYSSLENGIRNPELVNVAPAQLQVEGAAGLRLRNMQDSQGGANARFLRPILKMNTYLPNSFNQGLEL